MSLYVGVCRPPNFSQWKAMSLKSLQINQELPCGGLKSSSKHHCCFRFVKWPFPYTPDTYNQELSSFNLKQKWTSHARVHNNSNWNSSHKSKSPPDFPWAGYKNWQYLAIKQLELALLAGLLSIVSETKTKVGLLSWICSLRYHLVEARPNPRQF